MFVFTSRAVSGTVTSGVYRQTEKVLPGLTGAPVMTVWTLARVVRHLHVSLDNVQLDYSRWTVDSGVFEFCFRQRTTSKVVRFVLTQWSAVTPGT